MWRLCWMFALAALIAAPAGAQSSFPDLRGTWTGDSESIVTGKGNPHHPGSPDPSPRYDSVPFKLTIDKQDGRRFSGAFASAQFSKTLIGVITRGGTVLLVDDDGYGNGTLLASDLLELCYLQTGPGGHVASCTELKKQP